MNVGTWSDCYAADNRWEDENLAAKDLIQLLNPADPNDCTTNLLVLIERLQFLF